MPQVQTTGATRQAARIATHVEFTAQRLKDAPTAKVTRQQRRLADRRAFKRLPARA